MNLTTASHVALLAPVPKEHLEDGRQTVLTKGKVAFGSRAWETFRKLDELRKEMPVDVYIYESDGSGHRDYLTSWKGRCIGHVDSDLDAHPDGLTFRPESTWKYAADNQGYWAVFWELDALEKLSPSERIHVSEFTPFGKKKAYGHAFSPEGPLLIEHP